MAKNSSKFATLGQQEADTADLESLVGYNLKRAYIIVEAHFREAVGKDGMSARVFSALSLTVSYPNITQIALARVMGIERSGLVAIVDELEAYGYLQRAPVPGDRRIQALVPTEEGLAAYNEALGLVRDKEERLLSDLTGAERQTLFALLKKIRRMEED